MKTRMLLLLVAMVGCALTLHCWGQAPVITGFQPGEQLSWTNVPADDYLVVDLSAGPDASSYPVGYLTAVPAGGWTDEYKTTKMVFRRIPAGTFTMGSPTNELGRDAWPGATETQHQVTLTQPFYFGVFEVTQKQWERVMGTWPSFYNNVTCRDSRPVEQVSYCQIRENPDNSDDPAVSWPTNSTVNADSFMGRLRARTGRAFDLPTESQWEYAGRAGTTTALNSGKDLTATVNCPNMSEVGRYVCNGGSGYTQTGDTSVATAKVGSYLQNAWGLYDIHGNVDEWCLDWSEVYPTGPVSDPVGALTGLNRVLRCGSWADPAKWCRVGFHPGTSPQSVSWQSGFRVALPTGQRAILTSVASVRVPEGGSNTFQVSLSSQPTSDVTVAVAWTAGDSDITVMGGASLPFDTNNWDQYQTVTLAAAEDADTENGTATITCSGTGLVSTTVTATEAENDATLTVTAGAGGSTTPSGETVVTQGAATGIAATVDAGYVFANWSVTSGAATFSNSNAASTMVTISDPATVQANFIRVAILTSAAFVGVPEGDTAKFRVSLTAQPAGSVTVDVAHEGDSQLSVVSGGSLGFSTSDWSLWKTVILADAEDRVTNQRVATFTCSATGMDPVIVTATGIDNDGPVPVDNDCDGLPDALEARLGRATNAIEVLTALPFTERFESDTVSLGLLHGQHNWVVNPTNAATVQTGVVFEGARALQIEGTNDSSVAVSQAFTSTPQTVWLDLRIKVAGAAVPGSIPDAASVFFFDGDGQLVVCDGARPAGSQWVTLTNHTPHQAGNWARLTASADYALQTWSLYLDSTNVAANLGFAMPQKRLTCLSAEGLTGVLDSLYVGAARPDGIPGSNNTAPDDWYLDFLGTLVYGDTDDPDHDGMNNLAEFLAGTNPNDITSLLELTDVLTTPANPDKFIVRWQSATGRVYTLQAATNLLEGFSTLTNGIPATPTVNVYTDAVNGVGQKFYKVEVE